MSYRSPIEKRRLRKKITEGRASSLDGLFLLTVRSQGEVADILGITRQAVQQIERRALWKLRMRLAEFNPFTNET
jgi:DNA-directed RNA polymerase sigma subunit (sigma70/sigma32)